MPRIESKGMDFNRVFSALSLLISLFLLASFYFKSSEYSGQISLLQSTCFFVTPPLALSPFPLLLNYVTSFLLALPLPLSSSFLSVVLVTVPNVEVGRKISSDLLTNKLVACVNIVPGVESHYWWKGEITKDSELLLIIKTRTQLVPALTSRVKQIHSYTVPEVISFQIHQGSQDYLNWILSSTTAP
eukprot:TRINITY_DN3432_c0_g1_i2.p1 TRINITY_DN3432_c0_g1~~TRINITY_DN3432_c0_g1_i2.p1  ORF type:complete len:199 (+),score=47.07 TRINITY_DN3432_c0_g1_i2:39-599(+)